MESLKHQKCDFPLVSVVLAKRRRIEYTGACIEAGMEIRFQRPYAAEDDKVARVPSPLHPVAVTGRGKKLRRMNLWVFRRLSYVIKLLESN